MVEEASRATKRPPVRRVGWLLAVPIALSVAAYARVLDGELQFDDVRMALQKGPIQDLGASLRAFPAAMLRSGRPVTDLTFAMNHAVGGFQPWNFHVTNLAIHLAVVLLVFLFTRAVLRLAGADRSAGLAVTVAGLFALHPLHSQAVSYVSQRAEALASGLYLAALLLLLAAERRGRGAAGAAAWLAGLAAFALGLGAKAIVVTLPATYLLLAWMVPGEEARRGLARWPVRIAMLLPWLALDAHFAWTTLRGVEGRADAGFSVPGASPGSYFVTQWRAVATYLRLLFWPSGQNVDWAFPLSRSIAEPAVLSAGLALLLVAAGAGAVFWRSRRQEDADGAAGRVASFGVAWFFLVLAPTSSVVPVVDALVEHRVYLASWGVLAASAVAAERWLARHRGARRVPAAPLAVGAVWCALAVVLHQRNAVWETQLALWSDAAAKAPRNVRAHLNLGLLHQGRQEADAALREFRLALASVGPDTPDAPRALSNIGIVLTEAGRPGEALDPLRRAYALRPESPAIAANLATALWLAGDVAGAEELAKRAIASKPDYAGALLVLGAARLTRGDPAGALEPLAAAARADPDDAVRHHYLGMALARLGRTAEACAAWERGLKLRAAADVRQATAREAAALGCRAR